MTSSLRQSCDKDRECSKKYEWKKGENQCLWWDWNWGIKDSREGGLNHASEATIIPHSRVSMTWQHLRDNGCDPVARFQLAGCVQQLRWKGNRVFTEPQGCLITAWKQASLPVTKSRRTQRERQAPAVLALSGMRSLKSSSHLCLFFFCFCFFFFPHYFSWAYLSYDLIDYSWQLMLKTDL